MQIRAILATLALVVVATSMATSATIRVPQDQPTIQAGINVSGFLDTVLVDPGTYPEHIDFAGKSILVTSSGGSPYSTIRSVTGGTPVVSFVTGEDTLSVLDGFTVDGNNQSQCIVCVHTGPTVRNCVLRRGNASYGGGGIWCSACNGHFSDNELDSNVAVYGGAIALQGASDVLITGNVIYGNHSSSHGPGIGISGSSSCLVSRNIVYANSSPMGSWGAGIWFEGANHQIINNTVVANSIGISTNSGGGSTIENNIVISNIREGIYDNASSSTVAYNDAWDNGSYNSPGVNGISADPLFVDPMNAYFSLSGGSPCIDAGNPSTPVPDGGGPRVDIGAIERIGGLVRVNLISPSAGAVLPSIQPQFIWYMPVDTVTAEPYDEFRLILRGPSFTDTLLVGPDTTANSPEVLTQGLQYFWRIEALNDTGGVGYSPSYNFRIAHFPQPMSQIAPDAGATATGTTWLQWFQSSDADLNDMVSYTIDFSRDTLFSTIDLHVVGVLDSGGVPPARYNMRAADAATDSIVVVRLSNLPGYQALIDDVSYFWRVKGVDEFGAESPWASDGRWFNYQSTNTPPGPITLGMSPSDSDQTISLLPDLSWFAPSDPDDPQDSLHYQLQIDNDGEFVVDVLRNYPTGLGQTGYTLIDSLSDHTLWTWRVRAEDNHGAQSPWSEIQYFWTNSFNESPSNFVLQAPPTGSVAFTLLPELDWTASTDPDPLDTVDYIVELAVDANFHFRATIGPVSQPHMTLADSLPQGTNYWWRVRAVDPFGKSTPSAGTFTFRTFLAGDFDLSGAVTASDVITLVNYVFKSGTSPGPVWLGDVDHSCTVTSSDIIRLVNYIFKGGAGPMVGCTP